MESAVWTVIVAGGSGTRFGGPKQLADLAGRPVLHWSVGSARAVSNGVVVVINADLAEDPTVRGCGADVVVSGGATRSASVRAGLEVVPETAGIILVHDAARPGADEAVFRRVVEAIRAGAAGAVPVQPITDTVRRRDGGAVDRDEVVSVQTPQGFSAEVLRRAHRRDAVATDDATLLQIDGNEIVMVEGSRANLKITEPDDLRVVAALIAGQEEQDAPMNADDLRVGTGFDVHRFSDDPTRPLVLGGVVFPGERGLAGHSDADAAAHACAEAVLGAAGLPDLGQLFPDTDETWRGADSIGLLAEVGARVRAQGWRVANVDCSVVAEAPKLAPRKGEMQERLSAALGAPVTVSGRRAEGIGGIGRGEGIAALATALLVRSGFGPEEASP